MSQRILSIGTVVMAFLAAGASFMFAQRGIAVLELVGTGPTDDLSGSTTDSDKGNMASVHGQQSCLVTGLVLEADGGQPLPGAVVVAFRKGAIGAPGTQDEPDPNFAVTGLDGRWTIALADSGPAAFTATALPFLPATIETSNSCDELDRVGITFRLRRGGVLVKGMTIGPSASPVGDALILAQQIGGGEQTSGLQAWFGARSCVDGRYWLQLTQGNYLFRAAHAGGFASSPVTRNLGRQQNRVDFALLPTASVAGRVKTSDDRQGLGMIAVTLVHDSDPSGISKPPQVAWTNELGEFEVRQVRPGTVSLSARGRDLASSQPVSIRLVPSERTHGVVLAIDPAHNISGKVLKSGTGQEAIENVWAYARDVLSGGLVAADRPTDETGHFRILGLRPSTYAIELLTDPSILRAVGDPIILTDSDIESPPFLLDPGVTISGRVVPSLPAEVRLVRVLEDRLTGAATMGTSHTSLVSTNESDGSFAFRGVAPGRITLAAESKDGQRGDARVTVENHDIYDFTLRLEGKGAISGQVLEVTGEPPQNAWVGVHVCGQEKSASSKLPSAAGRFLDAAALPNTATSYQVSPRLPLAVAAAKADGSFEVTGLDAGHYCLTVHGEEGRFFPVRRSATSYEIFLGPREVRSDVLLEVAPCSNDISGIVTDSKGDPASGVWIEAEVQGSTWMRTFPPSAHVDHVTISDQDGHFSIPNLCLFTYRVWARDLKNRRIAYASNVPSGAGLKLRLENTGILEGAVEFQGRPVKNYSLVVCGPVEEKLAITDSKSFRTSDLPPGTYELFVSAELGWGLSSAALTANATEWRNVNLIPWSTLKGKLTSRRNIPLANVDVWLSYQSLSSQPRDEIALSSSLWGSHVRTQPDGSFKIEHLAGRRCRISFFTSRGPLLVSNTTISTSMGVFAGPNQWLEIPPWSGDELDLGGIEVMTGELP